MAEDLPIYPEPTLRTRLQFADLERLKHIDTAPLWEQSDVVMERFEGGANVRLAREKAIGPAKTDLLAMHFTVFGGGLRQKSMRPVFRGQDCPDPEFIDRSLDNFFRWLAAESVAEIHPIERAALSLIRVVDIWPFDAGNLTMAIMLGNLVLRDAGLPPFFVAPEHKKEFQAVIAQAMMIDTQPLINAIYKTIQRELESVASR